MPSRHSSVTETRSLSSIYQRIPYFYLTESSEKQSNLPNAGFSLLIYTPEEVPGATDCVIALRKRIKNAQKRAEELTIKMPAAFYVYPLKGGILDMIDDEAFCYIVRCKKASIGDFKQAFFVGILAIISFCAGLVLPQYAVPDPLSDFLKSVLSSSIFGAALTLLYEQAKDTGKPYLDLDDAVTRDTKHIPKNRTEETIETYDEPTKPLKRSKRKGPSDEQ